MAGKGLLAGIVLSCVVVSAAFGDTIVLENGAELRNVKIVEESEHTVKVNIIGYTNIILGKSKIVKVEREGGPAPASVPTTKAPEPSGTVLPDVEPGARRAVASRTVYEIPTDQQDKHVEVVVAALGDGTTSIEIVPPPGEAGEKEQLYVLTTEDGEKINVAVQRDGYGDVVTMAINPPEPPRTSPKDVFEYNVKSVDGKTLKIKAKWDWNTRTVRDLEFLP